MSCRAESRVLRNRNRAIHCWYPSRALPHNKHTLASFTTAEAGIWQEIASTVFETRREDHLENIHLLFLQIELQFQANPSLVSSN